MEAKTVENIGIVISLVGRLSDFVTSLPPDHLPVALVAVVPPSFKTSVVKRRRLKYDRKALQDPVIAARVSQRLDSINPIPYNVDCSSHVHIVAQQCHSILCEECPKPRASKRNPDISDSSFKLILDKKQMQKEIRGIGRELREINLSIVFYAWNNNSNGGKAAENWAHTTQQHPG